MSRMNYDPNICNKPTKQTVELTLQQWRYKATITVDLTTNAVGADVIDMAIQKAWEEMDVNGHDEATITLQYRNSVLQCTQDFDQPRDEEWLRRMVVGARISLNGGAGK